jgi:nucleoside-diphosphate kinase
MGLHEGKSIWYNQYYKSNPESFMITKEVTLSIIKPDGVQNNHIGNIIDRFESAGLRIAGLKMLRLTREQGEQFYAVHKERPFFDELADYISSGPIVVIALEGPGAIAKNRELMGATNPSEAAAGTIRADFAESIGKNTVHGSDAPETAKTEVAFFFSDEELF